MRRIILINILFLSAASSANAQEDLRLLLELWVNDTNRHIVSTVIQRDDKLLVSAQDLSLAGIQTSAAETGKDGMVDLYQLSHVNMRYSDVEQKLLLSVGPSRLLPQVFDLNSQRVKNKAESASGFIGQYDITGSVDNFDNTRDTSSLGTVLGGTFFTPDGNITANGFTQTQHSGSRAVRLDTAAEINDQEKLRKFVIGDAVSGSQAWGRSRRFSGLQIATDFSLRPDLNTMPLPAFFGQTSVPANVDIFVNSARVFESEVEPGTFQINNLPVITGNGQAQVVVRDVTGREATVSLPFYASNSLLRPGLDSYDFDIGFLRKGYGLQSFDYGELAASGTYSTGINDKLTMEGHVETSQDVQLIGGGGILALGSYGIIHPALAVSHSNIADNREAGALYSLSFEAQNNPFGFFGSFGITSGNYNDIASSDGKPPPELQIQLSTNVNLAKNGTLGGSFIAAKQHDQEMSKIVTASYNLPLGAGYSISTTGFYDYTRGEVVAQAFFSIALGSNAVGNVSVQKSRDSYIQQASYTDPANPDGGFGYQLSASTGDSRIGQANATWIGQRGNLDGAIAVRDGDLATRASASGGLVYIDDSLYATRRPNGAVALVRTGQADTKIYQENRQVAVANEAGNALVTGLVPFADNRISVDPANYNFKTIIDDAEKTVTPARSSGVIVDFTPQANSPALLMLRLKDDSLPPVGARVTLNNSTEPLIVGRRGELFIANLSEPIEGKIEFSNKSCMFRATPVHALNDTIPHLDPVYCVSKESQ